MWRTIKACCLLYGLGPECARKAIDMAYNDGLIDKIERQACQLALCSIGQ